ncbi:CPBP family intramembrane metalloprotease [Anaerocolumna sedimenticola]|uniref:CPBP family intramembrane metalloprotease n=1 Tax=Anaerocolumna sedimenticola TaxID=2696063 RepID=A0A6P1TQ68_9FIRM|nr:type II CAAX endopeptidase family protein [Anaerocolumna sedimenticola]QHQ63400.1 CPBP family intramembrane metalloprotease [Anaerocolumna sedimenticola]
MKVLNHYLKESLLFLQPKTSKVKLNIPLTIVVYFLLWLIGLGLGRLFVQAVFNVLGLMTNVNGTIMITLRKLIICGAQITIFFSWVKFVEKRPVNSIGLKANSPFKLYITGFMIGLCAITAITLTLHLTGMIKLKYYPLYYGYMIINLGSIALGWIVQSASEEIAIRGWLIPSLEKNCTPVMAISITAIIFGILHLFSSGVTVLSFINLILSGVFFAGYAILNGNIWGVCGLHFAWNFALGNIYGLPVSGFAANGEKIFQTQQIGSNLLTGGDFGPEGGLVTTVTLLIAIAVLILKWKKNNING